MQERRLHRLESLIKEKIATLLLQGMSDPRIGLVTITRVKLDRELSVCEVFWSVFGDEKQRRMNDRTLRHAAGYVRREIASVLHTRNVPLVTFTYDESVAGEMRIQQILLDLRTQREKTAGSVPESVPESIPESIDADAPHATEDTTDARRLPPGGADA